MCSAAVFSGMLYLLFVFSICKRKTSPCGLAGWVAIYIEGRRKKEVGLMYSERETSCGLARSRQNRCMPCVCLNHISSPLIIVPPIESTKVDAQRTRGEARLQLSQMRPACSPAISSTSPV